MKDLLKELWELQAAQQRELGLDPASLDEIAARFASNDLASSLAEETAELTKSVGRYKAHLLTERAPDPVNVALGVAGVFKMAVSIAQLYGLDAEAIMDAIRSETEVVRQRHRTSQSNLKENTHVLGVDLDDVTLDLEEWRIGLREIQGRDLTAAAKIAAEEAWKDNFHKSGRFRELEPIPGAPAALREIHSYGIKLAFITARPQWQYKRIYGDTLYSLNKHSIPHDLLLFNKDKVEAIYQHIVPAWPMAVVEDLERNARALSKAGITVYLFDRPHNRHIEPLPNVTRVFGWEEIVERLRGLIL